MQSTLAKKTFDETTTKRAFELVGSRADSILNKKLVAAMIGVSVSTLDRMVKAGTFPQAKKISPRRVGWRLSAVQAWISSGPQREP
jgi:predicted DNA-binding transcriptional regulator AlpA